MKKRIASFLIALILAFQVASLQPQRAHAIVGGVTGNVVVTVFGSVYLALGGVGLGVGGAISDGWRDMNFADAQLLGYSVAAMVGGVILLDEQSGLPAFTILSDDLIAGAQLSDEEVMAYQLELPELNRALYAVANDLAAQGVTTVEGALAHEALWSSHASGLLPETRSALTKIGAYLNGRGAQ